MLIFSRRLPLLYPYIQNSRELIKMQRMHDTPHQLELEYKDITNVVNTSIAYFPQDYLPLIEELGKRIITRDLEELVDHAVKIAHAPSVTERNHRIRQHVELILSTRTTIKDDPTLDKKLVIAASNAISILNCGGLCGLLYFQFTHIRDWSRIRVPYANLNMAVLEGCRFDRADLSHASFYLTNLRFASFKEANLEQATVYSSEPFHCNSKAREVLMAPSGQTFAVLCEDQHVDLWHIDSRLQHKLDANPACMAYSPDSSYLATGGNDGQVRVWDVASGTCIATFAAAGTRADCVTALTFSTNDSQLLAVGSNRGNVGVWRISLVGGEASVVCTQSFAASSETAIEYLAFSSSASLVAAVTSSTTIHTWDISTHPAAKLKFTLQSDWHVQRFTCASDGSHVAAYTSAGVCIWECFTGKCAEVMKSPLILDMAGQWLKFEAADYGTSPRVSPFDRQPEDEVPLIAACAELGICVWNILPGFTWINTKSKLPMWVHMQGAVVAFSADGRRFITINECRSSTTLTACDATRFNWTSTLYQHARKSGNLVAAEGPSGVCTSPDGRIIVAWESRHKLAFWDVLEAKHLNTVTYDDALRKALEAKGCQSLEEAYSDFLSSEEDDGSNPRFRSFEEFKKACRRNPSSFLNRLTLAELDFIGVEDCYGTFGDARHLSFSADGTKLLVSGYEIVCAIEVPSGRLLQVFRRFLDQNGDVGWLIEDHIADFVDDGRKVLVHTFPCQDNNATVVIFDYETRQAVYNGNMSHLLYAYGHVLSQDGTVARIKVNDQGAVWVSVFDPAQPNHVVRAKAPRNHMTGPEFGPLENVKLSPRGDQIGCLLRTNVLGLWNLPRLNRTRKTKTTQLVCKRLNHPSKIVSYSWIADGQFILTGTDAGLICIWDPTTGECIRKFKHGDSMIGIHVSSSSDCQPTITTRAGRVTRVWKLDLTELVKSAQSLAEVSVYDDGPFTLIRVFGHGVASDRLHCNQRGAILTRAWRI